MTPLLSTLAIIPLLILPNTIQALTISPPPAIQPQALNFNNTISNLSLTAPINLPLAENVQYELDHLTKTQIYPDLTGAHLYWLWARRLPTQPYPLRASNLRKLDMLLVLDRPAHGFNFVTTQNYAGWIEWRAPKPGVRTQPFQYMGLTQYAFDWAQVQTLMSIDDADDRLRAAGYGDALVSVAVMKAGGETEGSAVLGYYFRLEGRPGDECARHVRVNAVDGDVTKMMPWPK